MAETKRFNANLPRKTFEQLEILSKYYGDMTKTVIIAVDRLAREEERKRKESGNA